MLEIIQHQQQLLAPQVVDQLRFERSCARETEAQGAGNSGRKLAGLAQWGELHQPGAVHSVVKTGACKFHSQLCLAGAARPHQGQQPAVGRKQPAAQLCQFGSAADGLGRGRGEVVSRPGQGDLDALVQRRRFGGGLDAQLLPEQAAAALVLRQRSGALAGARQGQHELAVRFLTPRIKRQQPGGIADRPGVVAQVKMKLGQGVEGVKRKLPVARPLSQHPLLERGRVAHKEPGQEVPGVESNRSLQPLGAHLGGKRRLEVKLSFEYFDIQETRCSLVQFHRLAGDEQMRIQRPPQVGDGLPQVVPGVDVGHFAPQQSGQVVAALGASRDGQVGHQRRHLVRHEGRERNAILDDAKSAKQTNFQFVDHRPLRQTISKRSPATMVRV